ncbi:unnamed protein product [Rotaria sp. Silwood1]|nr:unnamed protein product [Rotaria sp. Silwood1]CAF1152940.1 unnamed protein product [Rotaria sp. Silwood1]CAF3441373.1 unnamed protein product [Rotaria sp. Silwood1]CAF3462484.1 unnamed protein product [Rotaria sp. Silwood1]CAF3560105.1 unnamed protein product [Rotaria sp. Silwood1]
MYTTRNSTVLNSIYPWLRLPPTPKLPLPHAGQYALVNGIRIWYTIYGPADGIPILFLHGGFANSDYWGLQVKQLQSTYKCILMDSRGQGRSPSSATNITYDLMTSDVIGLLDYLDITRIHLVGWSDGAIIGLNMAMKYPRRLISLFAFAANYDSSGAKDILASPVFPAYLTRSKSEYEQMSPVNNYQDLYNNLTTMWSTLPNWSKTDFDKIPHNLPVLIVDADHEEVINREQTDMMATWIQQAGEMILPKTSHFAFIQDPESFTAAMTRFLTETQHL